MLRFVVFILAWFVGTACAQKTVTFDSSGVWTVPAGVTSVVVEAWGGGGGGHNGSSASSYGGGGGGGGAYASSTLSVLPGEVYVIAIGAGGSSGSNGGATSFGGTRVIAAGGSAGATSAGGSGATVAASTGTTKHAGCNGGNGQTATPGTEAGGGGGSSPNSSGTCAVGGNASGSTPGTGGAGEGPGGDGGSGNTWGEDGTQPGGGGGGGSADVDSDGGDGADGRIKLTYTPPAAGGGTGGCTTSTVGSDTVVTCNSDGTFTIPSGITKLRYLVVAGGGGGGGIQNVDAYGSGGGGGGGVKSASALAVAAGTTYAITVGSGGAGGVGGSTRGGNGGDSSFGTIAATGGGGGASQSVSSNYGAAGGSGGGGRNQGYGGSGIAGQGNNGGDGDGWGTSVGGGGGGGGAGSIGATGSGANGGNGGAGMVSDISGVATYYGGGGGGGGYGSGTAGAGGSGGGASAPSARGAGNAATANTGGGGGAASGSTSGLAYSGGAGGSGIVILRYNSSQVCTTFRDEFSSASYALNAGTANWSGSWVETGDDASASTGTIRISGGRLQFAGNGAGGAATFGGPSVAREINLSTYTTATLSFDYSESGRWESDDFFDVYVSKDGGLNWTRVKSFQDDQGATTQSLSIDVSAYVSSNFRVAFVERANRADEIFYIDNVQVEACAAASALDHVRIEHSGAGVTCAREAVTVKACQNSDCSTLYSSGSVSLTLSPSGAWYGAASGGTASNTLTFTGSATAYLQQTTAGTVTLSASGVSPTPANVARCYVGTTQNCDITFGNAGFIFAAEANGDEITIPSHTAGTASTTYQLRAVKTNTSTKACEAALTGANTVDFAYECLSPATCYAADLMSMNGGTAKTVAGNNGGSVTSYTALDMTFDSNGNAPFTFNYSDAGSIKLHARKAAGGALQTTLAGATNAFVVKPAGFSLTATCTADSTANAASQTSPGPADAKFCRAGRAFAASARAVTSAGTTAYNYGRESTPETVAVTWSRYSPTGTGTSDGTVPSATLGYTGDATNFTGTFAASGLSWDEVGILGAAIKVGDDDYLGAGNVTSIAYVGRFYPDHFDTTLTGQCGGFAYSGHPETAVVTGQPFTVAATARNGSGGKTVNYANASGYAKEVDISVSSNSSSGKLYVDSALAGSGAIPAGKFASGVGTAAHSDTSGKISFVFGTYPTAATTIALHAEDADTASSTAGTYTDGTISIRAGRLWLGNAFGSDRTNLAIPYETQFWNGNAYVRNTADTCTSFTDASLALGNYQGGINSTNMGIGKFVVGAIGSGAGAITVSAPAAAAAGSLDVAVALGGTTTPNVAWTPSVGATAGAGVPWLRGKWYSTNYDRDPTARATFGVFGSNLKRGPVYLRESY